MKRIKNADINLKLNPKRINLNNFSMRFYTVNSKAYFFIKDQDNVVSVEREATIYDDPEVIISGGTVAVDYYLPLDWSELVQLGEGVLNYRCINNIDDPFFPDLVYNQVVEDTTAYYIDSDIHIDPAEDDKNLIERVIELESNLAVETADREDADVFLSGAVDTEIARAISAETELSERIDAIESGASEALDAEIERAISAETALQDAIDAEEARAIAIENAIRQDLTDESEIRSSADTAMWTAINDEIVRSTSAETALDNKIDVENLRAIGVENAISGNLETYKATNNAALQAETTRATSAETALQSAINDEATARANADAALGTRIDSISSASTAAIEAEAARAQEAESGLTNAINNEVTRATSAETIIANSLNAEINRATSAETALNNQIDAEVLRATAREAELEAKIGVVSGVTELINAETLRATTAENALDEKIGNVSGNVISEETRATSAEAALDVKIGTVSGNVITETTRATTAENALSGAIDSISAATSGSVEELDAKIDQEIADRTADVDAEETRAKGVENVLSGAIDTLDVRFFDDAKYEDSGNTKVINFYNGNVVKATIDASDFIVDGMVEDVRIENGYLVIDFNTASGKQDIRIPLTDIFNPANYYTKSETSGATEISSALAEKLAISDFNTYSGNVDTLINSKASQSTVDALNGVVTAHTNDSTIHLTSGNVQTQIDNSISGKANSSDVYLKTETSGATELATAFASKQNQLVAGENITIDANNVISAEGGGKAIEAGRGISVTTGETADTVSFNLPISAGTGTSSIIFSTYSNKATGSCSVSFNGSDFHPNRAYGQCSFVQGEENTAYSRGSHAEGYGTRAGDPNNSDSQWAHAEGYFANAYGKYSHAEGINTLASGEGSHTEGYYTIANNDSEHASGRYNVSSSASTSFGNSGNTLFSVGNGIDENSRHNAFEIRQNGDIYLTKDGQDVKLQDQLGGSSYTAGDGIDITNDVISVTGKVSTSDFDTYSGAVDTTINSKASQSDLDVLSGTVEDNEEVTAAALNVLNAALSDKADSSTVDTLSGTVTANTADIATVSGNVNTISGDVATNTTNIATVSAATASNTTALGGLKLQQISQSDYDNLQTKDSSTLYIII